MAMSDTQLETTPSELHLDQERDSLLQKKYEELAKYVVGLLVKYPGEKIEELGEWAEFRNRRFEIRAILKSVRDIAMSTGAYDRYAAWLLNGPISFANNITAVSHYLVADCVQSYQSMFSPETSVESENQPSTEPFSSVVPTN